MRYELLRTTVFEANRALGTSGLVVLTWGNLSQIDREHGVFAIKPSGVSYASLVPEDMVVVDLESGEPVAGRRRPSSDTKTHLALYRAFPRVGGIVHTHSTYATAWAQAGRAVPCLGTTHADTFHGRIPITRNLTEEEISSDYETATGEVVVEHFSESDLDPLHTPGVLLPHHGPFAWGVDSASALEHAIVLEAVAKMAYLARTLAPEGPAAPAALVEKHFERKHGPKAYYGQE